MMMMMIRKKERRFNVRFTVQRQRRGRPEYTERDQLRHPRRKLKTVTQRRVIHGAGSKSKIPIEEEVDLRGEKVSLKSGMKRCTGGRSTKSERKRIPDS